MGLTLALTLHPQPLLGNKKSALVSRPDYLSGGLGACHGHEAPEAMRDPKAEPRQIALENA